MNKPILFFLVVGYFFCLGHAFAQTESGILTIESYAPTTKAFLALDQSDEAIRDNDILNEELIDLVHVFTVDSILKKKHQRHRALGFMTGIIKLFGYSWRSINHRKEKFVGTSKRNYVPGHPPKFKEYDVNFDLIPHLKKYIDLGFVAYEKQKEIGRNPKKKIDYSKAPFVYPDENANLNKYRMHVECTPPQGDLLEGLNEKFYPCITGTSCETHPKFEDGKPTMGVYGAFISDCNHTCHPEIHPYEWIWWMNLSKNKKRTNKQWVFALMRDCSERLRGWQKGPRTGVIAIPFISKPDAEELHVHLKHLVHNDVFYGEKLEAIEESQHGETFDFTEKIFEVNDGKANKINIRFTANKTLDSEGLKFWFSKINFDEKLKRISGYLHIGVAVDELYSGEISMN